MATITFLPARMRLDVPSGTPLIDAAGQAGIMLDLPCGGKGTCGKCLVQVSAGTVDFNPIVPLAEEEQTAGWVHACRTTISADVTIAIPEPGMPAILDDSLDSADLAAPVPVELSPLTRQIRVQVPRPEPEDGLADLDRLSKAITPHLPPLFPPSGGKRAKDGTDGLSAAVCSGEPIRTVSCPLPPDGGRGVGDRGEPLLPLSVIRDLAEALRAEDGRVTVTLAPENAPVRVIDITPAGHPHLGIAVDLGTTTVSVQLVDLDSGGVLATRNGYNEQIRCGLDVISRINYASTPVRVEDLRARAVRSINRLIHATIDNASTCADAITGCWISGNTIMTHLLLGLKPEHIRLEPYTPTVLRLPPLSAGALGLAIHPEAIVALSPCVGSYVGGDITAGLLVTNLVQNTQEICLFIDIGTNGEIVLGNRDFLMTCACSAGPAFEGGGIECGMRATTGAIDRVTIDPDTGRAAYTTIGNAAPAGICGSGLIDLLAGLFLTGWVDASGKLERTRPCAGIQGKGRRARYIIVAAEETLSGKPIFVSENDIENLMRAKAAIYSAASVLLAQAGIAFADLGTFFIAGGFGRALDLAQAQVIGLLPDIPVEKFAYLGNASLAGSRLCLLSKVFRDAQTAAARRMTYIDLSTFPGYMDQYTAALFLPHTDIRLFPQVKQKKKAHNSAG